MKKFLALGSLMLALNGYTQSYLILNNGVTLTTDKAGFVYDFGHFILPYKVTLTGGQFLAQEEKFISIDSSGFLYRKEEKAPSKVRGKGSNYVLAENGTLFTFDSAGFLYKYEKESILKKAHGFGGRFFTVKPEERKPEVFLYTLNDKGNYFRIDVPGLNAAEIVVKGGNYFQTRDGVVYTVSKDGFVFPKTDNKTGSVFKAGGNFFVDSANAIYTVSEDGLLSLPALPANLKIENILRVGQNYFLDKEGRIFAVDNFGALYERDMSSMGTNLKDVKIISL